VIEEAYPENTFRGKGRFLWCVAMNKIDRKKAENFYRKALDYVKASKPRELKWVKKISRKTFDRLSAYKFLSEYCWVVYGSGYSEKALRKIFDELEISFKYFNIKKLYGMRSVSAPLKVFNNKKKAAPFLRGAKMIYEEGFSNFKRRLRNEGMDALLELPGIGKITQKLLAKNIGLLDAAKDDIWLRRVSKQLKASDTQELSNYLAKSISEKRGVIDLVIWRFCADKGWKKYNAISLSDFVKNLNA
jgi:hypothetical protein